MFCDECRDFSDVFSETTEVIYRQVEHQIRFHSLPRAPASARRADWRRRRNPPFLVCASIAFTTIIRHRSQDSAGGVCIGAANGGLRLPPSLCELRRTSRLNPPYALASPLPLAGEVVSHR